ncbi:MAG: polymer-forming cytoskeletal protein [Steroidobacterales bacterium]
MFERRRNKRTQIHTLISAKTRIDGDVTFCGGLHLDGTINGNVKAEDSKTDFLSVSEQACIEGTVSVPNIILNGLVRGDINASERVKLGPSARVIGNVGYANIETAIGAQINGKLIHKPDLAAQAAESGVTAPDAAAQTGPIETPSL